MAPIRHGFTLIALLLLALFVSRIADAQLGQIERARQFTTVLPSTERGTETAGPDIGVAAPEHNDDAFGAQVLMKNQERPKPFSGFAEIGAFVTNNVALTRQDRHSDSFLVGTVGASYVRNITSSVRLDAGVRGAAYRYGKFSALDFQSVDLTVGASWAPAPLRGAELLLRYTFTDLTSRKDTREFYNNHALLLGIQKVVPFSRAHGVYFGASAQLSTADPAETGRDEYVGYTGYRAQLTRSVEAEATYRYGRFVYREAHSRQDNNHAISVGVRYSPREWMTFSATTFASWNRSSRREFDYDAANVGVGAQVSVRF